MSDFHQTMTEEPPAEVQAAVRSAPADDSGLYTRRADARPWLLASATAVVGFGNRRSPRGPFRCTHS